jgi:hypothetical protein
MKPVFVESFDPDRGLVGEIDEETAQARDRRRRPYVVAWPDRCLAIDRTGGTMVFHSLAEGRQRGYLAYQLARKTRQWRLSHLYIEGAAGAGIFIEVPLWEGRAKVVVAPFESPSELEPPAENLRSLAPPEFGAWAAILSVPTSPTEWLEIPAGFVVA